MDIEGTYTLQAPAEEVWQCLMDAQTLRNAIPGLEHLTATGQHTYAFMLRIKQAPLRGVYSGQAIIDTVNYPGPPLSYHLSIEGDEQHNPFQGAWDIRLSQQQDNTTVTYTGMLNPGKISALLPPTLAKGALKILIQQFFINLAEQLRTTSRVLEVPAFDGTETPGRYFDEFEGQDEDGSTYAVDPFAGASSLPRTTLHTLVQRVGLGNHDPVLEEMWVRRFKRFGTFSALLLLVWIGTRLPRRLFPRH